MVRVYEIEKMVIQMKEPKTYTKVRVAEEPQGILQKKEYQMILNAAIEEEIPVNK